tara:strand:+ start:1567 stop:1752 length:186 start_codon:yes stop_codon:yes gene_type:complete
MPKLENVMTFKSNPEYKCPIHGKHEAIMFLDIEGDITKWCLKCVMIKMKESFSEMIEIKDE